MYIFFAAYCTLILFLFSGFLGSRQKTGSEEAFSFCELAHFLLKVFRGMLYLMDVIGPFLLSVSLLG